ncbi:MAG: 4'-phosphopantetheinyl transferase family protein [Wujia sp.]
MSAIRVIVRKVHTDYMENNYDRLIEMLYPERRTAVRRLRNRSAALVSLAAGLLLQDVAQKELGIRPEDLVVAREEYGKPYIEGHMDFCYNISHSGDYVVLAYGEMPVGVDIEQIREHDLDVAKRCFTAEENEYILHGYREGRGRLESATEYERFFQIWTMKESYLKLIGKGISIPLNSFEVSPYSMRVEGTDYSFDGRGISDYHISVCAEDTSEIVYIFEEREPQL